MFRIDTLFKSKNSTATYWPELDGIRTLAFMLVFISHIGLFPVDEISFHPFLEVIANVHNCIVVWGWIGVDLFFVLSAFLITTLLLKERKTFGQVSFKLFFIRRMCRIWPLYYLALILGFFILPMFNWMQIGIGSPFWSKMFSTHFLAFILFVANFQFALLIQIVTPMFNTLWSVCIEEQFYMVWGGLLKFFSNLRFLLFIVFSLLIMSITLRYFIQLNSLNHRPYYCNTLTHLDPLLFGVMAAIGWSKFPDVIKKISPGLFFTAITIIVSVMFFMPDIGKNSQSIVFGITALGIGLALFLLSVLSFPLARNFFALTPLVLIGRITYGMYIFHYPILMTCTPVIHKYYYTDGPITIWMMKFLWVFVITFLVSLISWNIYEKPFNNLRKRFSNKKIDNNYKIIENADLISFIN